MYRRQLSWTIFRVDNLRYCYGRASPFSFHLQPETSVRGSKNDGNKLERRMVGMENRQKDKLIAVAFRISHLPHSRAHQRREILERLWTPDHAMNIHFGCEQRVARVQFENGTTAAATTTIVVVVRLRCCCLPLNKYKSNSVICKWKSHVGKTRLVIYWLHVLRVLGINTIICIFSSAFHSTVSRLFSPFFSFSDFVSFALSCPPLDSITEYACNRLFRSVLHKSREKKWSGGNGSAS